MEEKYSSTAQTREGSHNQAPKKDEGTSTAKNPITRFFTWLSEKVSNLLNTITGGAKLEIEGVFNDDRFKDTNKEFANSIKSVVKQSVIDKAQGLGINATSEKGSLAIKFDPPIAKGQKQQLMETATKNTNALLTYNDRLDYKLSDSSESRHKIKGQSSEALGNVTSHAEKNNVSMQEAAGELAYQKSGDSIGMSSPAELRDIANTTDIATTDVSNAKLGDSKFHHQPQEINLTLRK